MRVVTTCHKAGLEQYGHRWLEARKHWPKDTDFQFYTEGFSVDCPGKDFTDLAEFSEWKLKHAHYQPPMWRWDVVRYAHKVFAAYDALRDHDGIGVWCDADCVAYKDIPEGAIEQQVDSAYIALYQRKGMYSETGFWVMNCSYPGHKDFMDGWADWYYSGRFRKLAEWHDCMTLDSMILRSGAPTKNLSGDHSMSMHPQAKSWLGQYLDHAKGPRKSAGISPENVWRR